MTCQPLRFIIAAAIASGMVAPASAQNENPSATREQRMAIVVRGTSGTEEYGKQFDEWAQRWIEAAERGGAQAVRIGPVEDTAERSDPIDPNVPDDRQRLQQTLEQFAASSHSNHDAELWIVLIGHGTFDGRTARFNLQGPDVSAAELSGWLEPVSCRTAVINCASASGPFLKTLSAPNRVIVTSTRSGAELNFSRFGGFLSQAIGDAAFDLDKDGQTSLLESFLSASRQTENFYDASGRLATEHALLDDTGDGRGTQADFFRGIRLVRQSSDGTAPDGRRAHEFHLVRSAGELAMPPALRTIRNRLERRVLELRDRKQQFPDENAYYAELEPVLIELAQVYEQADAEATATSPDRTGK